MIKLLRRRDPVDAGLNASQPDYVAAVERKIGQAFLSFLSRRRWYTLRMSTSCENTVLDEVLEPVVRCFTPDVARQVVALRAGPTLQARLDEFASKANEGALTEQEREEYEAYVEAIDLISILQAKARKILANDADPDG